MKFSVLHSSEKVLFLFSAVLNSLRHLSTSTSILSDPSKVPEQATQAVIQQRQHHSSGNSSSWLEEHRAEPL